MRVFLLCLCFTLDVANIAQTKEVKWESSGPASKKTSSHTSVGRTQSGAKWDRKTPVDPSIPYDLLPSDLKHLADLIEQADKLYKDPREQERCIALITVHRNLVPMLIAYNIGRPFKIQGPAGEVAEVKVQSGFYVASDSVWHQIVKCLLGRADTLMSSTNPRSLFPLFY